MDSKRFNSRKPFLFYNEDYYKEKPNNFYKTNAIIFKKLDLHATSIVKCKKLLTDFFDYCLPNYYRRKNRFHLMFRIIEPVIKQAGASTLATISNGQCHLLEINKFADNVIQDNKYAHKWLIKVVGTDMGQQILFIIKQVVKKFKSCNLGIQNYNKLFRRCLSVLIFKGKNDIFLKCLQIILNAAMPVKNKGVIKSNYAAAAASALHHFIVGNLQFLCSDVYVMIKVRRLLIKHSMLATENVIKSAFRQFSQKIDVSLFKKVMFNYMMTVYDNTMQWPSIMNDENLVDWTAKHRFKENTSFTNFYKPLYSIAHVRQKSRFKYYGWNAQKQFCRNENDFFGLVNLHLNKNGTKELKSVCTKYAD
ncbi:p43 protein [Thysanoplusia orichalcea nucleopolyhedrovirus]|uniref:p43 protein n=1 Tax=Thysanoplusia orichalcea nucleopolyhedrovirus TaxID=101850 RepID=L0CLG7_9ABAC|nr:p43 protein [Thysanoplusia orichalcea nucleopolyhedrovirus]AGA16193.1 p43 protein [Thysanoplusia orichalcea nucleopolyhedrovirus]